jgi:hypothetical protein
LYIERSGRAGRCDLLLAVGLLLAVNSLATWAQDAPGEGAAGSCSPAPGASYPTATISNGLIKAVIYPPDAQNGYYRGVRFDWSGVVGCLSYKGHSYFGVWFARYDPYLHDSITGPVEDFRSSDGVSSIGYEEAKAGEPFLKIGVGVLQRIDKAPYSFGRRYPLLNGGTWTTHSGASEVSSEQKLQADMGYAYTYTKTVKLDKHEPVLLLEHKLKNTGTKTIDTEVYDHDFYMLDNTPTGPGMVVRFPFEPKAMGTLKYGASIEGKEIVYARELSAKPAEAAMSFITGFSNTAADYDISVENTKTGAGVEQTADVPMAQMNFWSIHTTICPEAYIHLVIPPGKTARWTIRYRFYAK